MAHTCWNQAILLELNPKILIDIEKIIVFYFCSTILRIIALIIRIIIQVCSLQDSTSSYEVSDCEVDYTGVLDLYDEEIRHKDAEFVINIKSQIHSLTDEEVLEYIEDHLSDTAKHQREMVESQYAMFSGVNIYSIISL